jgi:Tol biopolymer transport system component
MLKSSCLTLLMLFFWISTINHQPKVTPEPENLPQIAFVSDRTGYHQVYLMNADGTEITQLTDMDFGRAISTIDCSPVDNLIAINEAVSIYVFEVDTNTISTLTTYGSDPAWSPDGTEVAYSSGQSGNFDIFRTTILNPAPINLTERVKGDRFPDWSPDGTKILFSSVREDQYGIFTMNSDGTEQTRLTSSTNLQDMGQWSPDGSQIAFVGDNGDEFNIYTMSATGKNITRLTGPNTSDWDPEWSPDGSKMLFSSYRDDHEDSEIYLMDADGRNPVRLTNDPSENYSPCWLIDKPNPDE